MAKTKTPFFSFGSRGSVGGVLTSQNRGGNTILRESPKPTDPYSLNQAYQRWDYRDYAYLWTLLSNAEKQVYRTKASRYHITGFSQWMRENLKTLPNLMGRWHLDDNQLVNIRDSSKQDNSGIIFGATPTSGIIDGAYLFDGVNDRIRCPIIPSIPFLTAITISVRFYWYGPTAETQQHPIGANGIMRLGYQNPATSTIGFYMGAPYTGGWLSGVIAPPNTWHSLIFTYDSTLGSNNSKIYHQGLLSIQENASGSLITMVSLEIGSLTGAQHSFNGIIDEVILKDRAIDATEALRLSQRRYPA